MKTPTTPSTNNNNNNTKHTSNSQKFIISCFFFIIFLCTLASINELKFNNSINSSVSGAGSGSGSAQTVVSNNPDEIRVLVGILTLPDQYQKRHFLRMIYGTQSSEGARIDLRFVFCNLTKDDQKVLVALEIMHYNDIIILNCTENMNKGKTYTYFSSLPKIFDNTNNNNNNNSSETGPYYPPYHYVLKADDDTYFRVDNLVKSLRPLPRDDLYYGYVIPCPSMDPFVNYMSGMGYLVSWDIVEWISESDIPKAHMEGPEDKVFGDWIRNGRRGKNRFNAKWSMYNYPEPATRCTHELWPDTIAVHLLKNQEKWIKTLEYFNVTKGLKPSKLYHIP